MIEHHETEDSDRLPAGPLLDALGVTLAVTPDQQLVEVVVIGKVVEFGDEDPGVSLVFGTNAGLDWIAQRGLVHVAEKLLSNGLAADEEED